jgi:hypothetical protein
MAEKKLTKKDKILMLLGIDQVKANPTLVEYLENEYNLLERKATSKTPSKNQVANEAIKNVILSVLSESATPMSIRDIQSANAELSDFSNQKMTALLTQLVDTDKVVRVVDKKKIYFTIKGLD